VYCGSGDIEAILVGFRRLGLRRAVHRPPPAAGASPPSTAQEKPHRSGALLASSSIGMNHACRSYIGRRRRWLREGHTLSQKWHGASPRPMACSVEPVSPGAADGGDRTGSRSIEAIVVSEVATIVCDLLGIGSAHGFIRRRRPRPPVLHRSGRGLSVLPYIRWIREAFARPGRGAAESSSMSLLTPSIKSPRVTRWNFGLLAMTLLGVLAIAVALMLPNSITP
jgi:hypothetical protein